jgi:uncharacterized protein (TIGR00369 family)
MAEPHTLQKISIDTPIEDLNSINKNTLMSQLGIEYLSVADGKVTGRMPVDARTYQPSGILHGGASLAFAETLAGLGSSLIVDMALYNVRGIQISANHIGFATNGYVYGEAELFHRGSMTHLWHVNIADASGKMISSCRVTNMIIEKK